jgi:MraZ protein
VFRGVSKINMDPKGRVAMPSRYREHLMEACAGRIVATIHFADRCLMLYPLDQWEFVQAQLEDLPSADPENRRVQRLLLGHATDLELDGSGRILLPQVLREFAQLDKQVALVGMGKRFELWSEEAWSGVTDEPSKGELPPELKSLRF